MRVSLVAKLVRFFQPPCFARTIANLVFVLDKMTARPAVG
jgi:hypothetical protein